MSKRPNVVFIMPDEWRPDAFGFAGNRVIRTPNVDALAARGASFRNTYCESPVCQASRASLVTGTYVRDHGLPDNDHLHWAQGKVFPGPQSDTFMKRLQRAGYRTAEIGKMHFSGPRRGKTMGQTGLGQGLAKMLQSQRNVDVRTRAGFVASYGFDEVYEEPDKFVLAFADSAYTDHLASKGLLEEFRAEQKRVMATMAGRASGPPAAPDVVPAEDTLDAFIGRRACEFIRDYDRDDPFFLWVAFVGPHAPFDGPSPYADHYDPADIPLGPLEPPEIPDNRWGEYLRWNRRHLGTERMSEEHYRLIGKHYYALCEMIDDWVGRIVSSLDDAGIADDTWILFGSDHGELLGDHGLISKRVFYRTSVNVPAVIAPPRGSERIVVDGPVQNFDLVGTILDVAGAETEGYLGRSLAPAFDGEDVARGVVFSQIAGFLMVATERHKLILDEVTLEPQSMFDLENDPDELNDVVGDPGYKDVVDDLTERCARPFLAGRATSS